MKKIISAIFVLSLVFLVLSGCGSESPEKCAENYLKATATLDFDSMDSYSIVSSKTLFEAQIEVYADSMKITVEEAIKNLANTYDFEASNTDEYISGFKKYTQNEFTEYYGEDYFKNINISIVNSQEMSNDEIESMLKEASDYYDTRGIIISDLCDFSKIKKSNKISFKIYSIDAEGEQQIQENSIYVVAIKGKWKVLNLGLGKY